MVVQLHHDNLSENTERYEDTGLEKKFLFDMAGVVAALKNAGYDPYAQLTGYLRTGNERYITRECNARNIVAKMDREQIRVFLKHCRF